MSENNMENGLHDPGDQEEANTGKNLLDIDSLIKDLDLSNMIPNLNPDPNNQTENPVPDINSLMENIDLNSLIKDINFNTLIANDGNETESLIPLDFNELMKNIDLNSITKSIDFNSLIDNNNNEGDHSAATLDAESLKKKINIAILFALTTHLMLKNPLTKWMLHNPLMKKTAGLMLNNPLMDSFKKIANIHVVDQNQFIEKIEQINQGLLALVNDLSELNHVLTNTKKQNE